MSLVEHGEENESYSAITRDSLYEPNFAHLNGGMCQIHLS